MSLAKKPLVLVVEDEMPLTTLLRYNLEKEGYRVNEARDGEEAMMMADEEMPDLTLLDWMLPKISGIEVCRRLRGRAESRSWRYPASRGWSDPVRCPSRPAPCCRARRSGCC